MKHYSDAFGARVKELLADNGLSPNSVEALSDRRVSHMTVRRMRNGYVPNSDHIIELVEAVGSAREWALVERKQVADELLALVESRARHYGSVMHALASGLRTAGARGMVSPASV